MLVSGWGKNQQLLPGHTSLSKNLLEVISKTSDQVIVYKPRDLILVIWRQTSHYIQYFVQNGFTSLPSMLHQQLQTRVDDGHGRLSIFSPECHFLTENHPSAAFFSALNSRKTASQIFILFTCLWSGSGDRPRRGNNAAFSLSQEVGFKSICDRK